MLRSLVGSEMCIRDRGVFAKGTSEVQHRQGCEVCKYTTCSSFQVICYDISKEREYMTHVPYASAVGSLMHAMVCTRPDLSQAISMVNRYMHDPGQGHWEAVIGFCGTLKVPLMLVWYLRRTPQGSRIVSDMLIPTMLVTLTSAGLQRGMSLHYLKHRLVGALFHSLPSHCLLQRPSIWP